MESVVKKHTTRNQQFLDPFMSFSLDVIIMILLKLPAKYIARLIFVSKQWSTVICSQDFFKLYMAHSSTRPHILFIYNNCRHTHILESCSEEDPSSDYQRVIIPSHPDNDMYRRQNVFSPPVRGLICLTNGANVRIENPSTGQFLTLPRVKTRRRHVSSFFGYDPENDVYKVLCMTEQRRKHPVLSEEHQVFTLGPKQKWRKITCKYPHRLDKDCRGICINGVVYYYSWIRWEAVLICFDLTSEDFNVIKLPESERTQSLVNYGGKIALWSQHNATLNLWILQDAKNQEWFEVTHLIPSWNDLVGNRAKFFFKGTLSTGKLIFAPNHCMFCNLYFLISYDPKEKTAKRVVIQENGNYIPYINSYLDHVESPMLLPNVN